MSKDLYIAEKPSVAREFAAALSISSTSGRDGFLEGSESVVTWCVGHLVTMSYPEVYDEKYRRWQLDTLPFLPDTFLYEVIDSSRKQFEIVKDLLLRPDIGRIFVCTDSGREGEYIYRLVAQEAGVSGKEQLRVWIDSQTREEILRGIREARPLSDYDNLAASAYLRAKEDYLMGINFSRLLTLKYGRSMASFLGEKRCVVSVGRVMTCVLGMVVRREREIRGFEKKPFFRVLADISPLQEEESPVLRGLEWRAVEGSRYFAHPALYKENGFSKIEDALALIDAIAAGGVTKDDSEGEGRTVCVPVPEAPVSGVIESVTRKKEKKNPPLLYNLAELQNDCAKLFHISPDETLATVQDLYEKKLVTYPRTDARVLSSAVAKEIRKNLDGLRQIGSVASAVEHILSEGFYQKIGGTRYTNDKLITDHYAIIPTGSGISGICSLPERSRRVYEVIVRRFLAIFLPPAVYERIALTVRISGEAFFASQKILSEEGYLRVMRYSFQRKSSGGTDGGNRHMLENTAKDGSREVNDAFDDADGGTALAQILPVLKKNGHVDVLQFSIREGETAPPKRYNSGGLILAMENAGQLIEDEDLRAQIRGSGIGTSATRAEILKKLVRIRYLSLNQKTQIVTPTLQGEMVFDVVRASLGSMLNPELTASWERGLSWMAEGRITEEEYMEKLSAYIQNNTRRVLSLYNQSQLQGAFSQAAAHYRKSS